MRFLLGFSLRSFALKYLFLGDEEAAAATEEWTTEQSVQKSLEPTHAESAAISHHEGNRF